MTGARSSKILPRLTRMNGMTQLRARGGRHPLRPRPRWKSGYHARVSDVALALVVALLAGTSTGGCSHVTPYYRAASGLVAPWVADDDVAARVLLIGDAGEPDPAGEPALEALAHQVSQIPRRTTIVFLGDNIYERGMPEPAPTPDPLQQAAVDAASLLISPVFQTRQEAERIINAQVAVVRGNGARAIFVPGNHDWDQSAPGGWKRILAQDAYLRLLRERDGLDVALLPSAGCPGPVRVPLQNAAELVLLDTQWWLTSNASEKPLPDNNPTGCRHLTEESVLRAFGDQLRAAAYAGRRSIVAAHHPLATHGAHSGFVDGLTHVFPMRMVRHYVPFYVEWLPLPGLGSLMAGVRACCSPTAQDMPNRTNRHMRRALLATMEAAAREGAAPLAYVAGHDHSLQVIESGIGPSLLVVSGLGSHGRASEVGSGRRTLFAHANDAHPGFVQIDVLRDGRARFAVFEYVAPRTPPREMYSQVLD